MLNLIRIEIFKLYSKWRTYIGFIAIGILFPLILYLIKVEGESFIDGEIRKVGKDFLISGNLFNAWIITEFVMNSLWVHVPFLIVLVSGDMLSSEATSGTYRLSLIRPISRTEFFLAKYTATLIYVASLIIFMFIISVGLGLFLFGSGDLISIDDGIFAIIPESEALWRIIFAFTLAIISMWVVATLAFLISSFVENAIGPIIGTMVVVVAFLIISNIPVASVEPYKPYLFTTHSSVWRDAFSFEINYEKIFDSVIALGINILILLSIAYVIFIRKDIRS